jgi:hypothetical protein
VTVLRARPSPATCALLGAALAALGAITFFLQCDLGIIDDAFISLRVARNWAAGWGPVFNPGERVEVSTSPAWTALLAAAMRLSLPPLQSSLALQFLAAAGAGAAAALLGWRLAGWRAAVAASLVLASLPAFGVFSGCGLETPLAACALAWAAWAALRAEGPLSAAIAGVLAAFAAMVRPEASVIAVLLVLLAGRSRRSLAAAAAACAVALGASLLLRHAFYGAWVPNTYVMKVEGGGLLLRLQGIRYVARFATLHPLLLAALAAGFLSLPAEGRWCSLIALAWLLAVAWEGGDHFWFARLAMPCLPICAALAGALFARLRGAAAWGAAVALAAQSAWGLARDDLPPTREEVQLARNKIDVGDALANLPPGRLAAVAIGALGWQSARPILDMTGLADPHIARSPRIPWAISGHNHADPEYVLRRAPELVLALAEIARRPLSDSDELRGLERYRRFFIAGELLLAHPLFRQRYRPEALRLATGWYARIWVRRDLH